MLSEAKPFGPIEEGEGDHNPLSVDLKELMQ